MTSIDSLRREIDKLHDELYVVFEKRRMLTEAIWDLKAHSEMPFFSSEREDEIVKNYTALSEGVSDPEVQKLHEGLMRALLKEYRAYLEAKYLSK